MAFWQDLKKLNKPIFALAPMDGVTEYVYRELVAITAKPDVIFTEFTNVESLFTAKPEKSLHRLKYSQNQRYIVAQLWGKKPENYYKAGKLAKELGLDGVDINMGCPFEKVQKLESGAALIGNYQKASEIIQALKEGAQGLGVSVKTRIGKTEITTEPWISFLLKQDIDALTIHGRTAKEMSQAPVHWDEIHKAVDLKNQINPEIVLLGNGDVLSQTQATEIYKNYGVDGVMIGKGIFANPWVFEKNEKNHSNQDYIDLLLKHTQMYIQEYPEKKHFTALRKHFLNYIKSFPHASLLKEQLMKVKNYEEVGEVIREFKNQQFPRE